MRRIALLVIMLTGVGLLAAAQQPAGFKGTKRVVLTEQAKVGSQVLPAGQYKVTHTMEGAQHIMVFKGGDQEYRIKCNLEQMKEKAHDTQFWYEESSGQRVLQAIEFEGDNVRHVFAE